MTVIVKAIKTFETVQLNDVSSISFASHTFTIVHGGGTSTYSDTSYRIFII